MRVGWLAKGTIAGNGKINALFEIARPRLSLRRLELGSRCSLKDILIALFFLALVVAPAFAALNVFTEKNRL
jgi:hypothetical protein